MSLEVGAFVGDLASKGAHALRGCLCAPSVKLARAALLWKMRQELGMCALRGHAKVIERARLENVGGRGAAHFGAALRRVRQRRRRGVEPRRTPPATGVAIVA
mmetsp:Transcript_41215/g.96971  ORF Transcript_41215/g.96971 Transcript_41215/m.96971 type:complete len:103 (+) Transcript_41215:533-841(+)